MSNAARACFAIIRYNLRTYESGEVVAVLRGRSRTETTIRQLNEERSPADLHAGWAYFIERTTLRPGMSLEKATTLRQTRLDARESKALARTAHDSPENGLRSPHSDDAEMAKDGDPLGAATSKDI
jgi:hypothetical protein